MLVRSKVVNPYRRLAMKGGGRKMTADAGSRARDYDATGGVPAGGVLAGARDVKRFALNGAAESIRRCSAAGIGCAAGWCGAANASAYFWASKLPGASTCHCPTIGSAAAKSFKENRAMLN